MSGLSVVIPSRDVRNLMPCVAAIQAHQPGIRIIVVDDGLIHSYEDASAHALWWDGIHRIDGAKPFIFACNCNLGIRSAGDDDVVLLNDDAILESPGGFTAMQEYSAQHPEFGLISATTNVAGNPAQHRRGLTGVREASKLPGHSAPVVAFVCVLIPRRTIEAVGLMDERFGGTTPEGKRIYGFCDNSYCRRVHNAGLKIGVHDGCYVDHGKLKSSFRTEPYDMEAARQIYLEMWGTM